jgi:hypothetical protein
MDRCEKVRLDDNLHNMKRRWHWPELGGVHL